MRHTLNIIFVTLFICLAFYKCKPKQGLGGDQSIFGTAYIKDSVSNNNIAVEGALVYIGFGYEPDATNYSYKVTSDKQGKFNVPHLQTTKDNEQFFLYAIYEKTNGTSKTTYTLSMKACLDVENTLELTSNSSIQNVTGRVLVKDSVSSGFIPVAGAEVFLGYNFPPNPSNYTYLVTTDVNGYFKTNKIDMSSGSSYQLYIRKNMTVGGNMISYARSLSYQQYSAATNSLVILPVDSTGYLSIRVVDNNSTPQPAFTCCIYSNRTFFVKDTLCDGSIYSSKTNTKGFIYNSTLNVGSKYYIKAYKISSNDTIWVKDSLTMPNIAHPTFTFVAN